MSKAGIDPLESAKVSNEAPAKKAGKAKKEATKKEAKPPGLDPLDSDTTVHPPSTSKKAPPAKAPPKFRVIADCTFSRNGHVTKLSAGSVISAQHYGGMPGIEKMMSGGLQLEEL